MEAVPEIIHLIYPSAGEGHSSVPASAAHPEGEVRCRQQHARRGTPGAACPVPEADEVQEEEAPEVDENLNQEEEDDLDALLNEIPEAEEDEEEPSKESSSDDDLDDISDEDLEALLKENGMI